ncbi:MAG: hypothetical protein GTO13_04815 [Proteobacteria bacterium]|nr:hypothetical protein [Pseudomonadota bacterium]
MEDFGYVIAIISMIVVLFIVTNVYWDSKSNKVYKRFERLLEVAEISHRTYMEERLREIERTIDQMRREMESAKARGSPSKSLEEVRQGSLDSSEIKEDRETMVVFRRRPKDDPSPIIK